MWPPDDVLAMLEGLPRPTLPGVRWTSRAQWHVTLRFLGEVDVDAVSAALEDVRVKAAEAELAPRTQRLGRGVLCVHVNGLEHVAAEVTAATAGLGRPPDHRRFRGHITLARIEARPQPPLNDLPARTWRVATFALVRSHLGGGPARYETVATWPLEP